MAEFPVHRQEPIEATYHLNISCFSCGERVNQLGCLPCLHSLSVCEGKECRQNLMERGASCQHCKEHFDVPPEGFPRYSFAERKASAKMMEEEGTVCHAKHDTPQVAVVCCSDCLGPLCEECHSAHRTIAILREHRIVSLEDAMKEGFASDFSLVCPTHKEELKCFCQDCEVLICTVCPSEGPHQSHSVLFVDEQSRQPLEQCIRSTEKRREEMSSAVRDVDGHLLTLHEESNRCKENIADLKEHMIEAVNRRCAILVAAVEKAEEKIRRHLEQHKNALEAQKNQLNLFNALAMEIVHEGTTGEQHFLRQAVIQRASSLTSIPLPPGPSSSNIFFVPEKKEEAEMILSVMGRVSLGPYPEAFSMEGLAIVGNTVECRPWSLPLNMSVVSRDCRGVECGRGGERVESVLTPIGCGVPVRGEVEDRRDGTYRVAFMWLPSEECWLSVSVNGSAIGDSPVKMKLRYPSGISQVIKDCQGRSFRALVCTKEGTLLATDHAKHEVSHLTQSGELLSSFKVLNPGGLYGLAVLSDGNIAVSVCTRNCVAVYRPNGEWVMEFGCDSLKHPRGLAVNHRGLFVVDSGHHRVCVFTEDGKFQYSFDVACAGPQHICISPDDLVYVNDFISHRILVFQQNGHFVRSFDRFITLPVGLTLAKDGNIVVACMGSNKVAILTPSGKLVHVVKGIKLNTPFSVAIANNGSIFVTDRDSCTIVKL